MAAPARAPSAFPVWLADDRAEQGAHRRAHDHCGVEALFGAAQVGDGLIAVGIVMHVRHLRAVFAGAARSQQAAKARHDDAAKRPFPGGEAPLHACLHALRVMSVQSNTVG